MHSILTNHEFKREKTKNVQNGRGWLEGTVDAFRIHQYLKRIGPADYEIVEIVLAQQQ